jgi:hypothetical protein
LQLFALEGEQVELQWGNRQRQVDLDSLSAPDCDEKLLAQREFGMKFPPSTSRSTAAQTPAVADEPVCAP